MHTFAEAYFAATSPPLPRSQFVAIAPLHLNEMPHDLPDSLRRQIHKSTQASSFNRYPEPFAASLVEALAGWYGCAPGNILVGPGSSSFIRLLLTFFGLHMKGQLIITRPSFAYYEEFCLAFGIPYGTWELDKAFEYDLTALRNLPDYSVVFLTSPNNPTGNILSQINMETLLRTHPRSMFVVDEAYAEFTDEVMLPLINKYDNLLILRTFSKAFSSAGIRCGSLISQEAMITVLGRLQTPWQMSPFTIEAAKTVIDYACETGWAQEQVRNLIAERERLSRSCTQRAGQNFRIYPSHANFILIQAAGLEAHDALLAACAQRGVMVANLHHLPRLAHAVRVTVGTRPHNALFEQALQDAAAVT